MTTITTTDMLRCIAEMSILLPGMLLAHLPVSDQTRFDCRKLAAVAAPLAVLLCLLGGSLCCCFSLNTRWLLLLLAAVFGAVYCCTLRVIPWKSVSIFLAVCAVYACIGGIAKAIDVMICPENPDPWLSLPAALAYVLMCWFITFASWYPATHAARELLEDDAFAQTWYVFWILPLLFIAFTTYIAPLHPEFLYKGHSMKLYIVTNLSLLLLLLLFYVLFYLIASALNKNHHLQQENQFLAMEQAQYDNLKTAIAETRQARHDMRHHFAALSSLAQRKEWEQLADYLFTVQKTIPDIELNLCDNPAVDGVLSHYALLCRRQSIPFSVELDLPRELPTAEIDLCLVLSNLLENAVEASLRTKTARRGISIRIYLHSSRMLLLTVENTFDGTIKEKDGRFQSSKRHGEGIGIQSVRRIAEKNGGYSRFTCDDGVFRADIMLRSAGQNGQK